MTNIVDRTDDAGGADLCRVARARVLEIVEKIDSTKTRLGRGKVTDAKLLGDQIAALNKALDVALQLQKRYAEEFRDAAKGQHDYAMDLDRAQFEIGRRLDRLRAAQAAPDVSGKPE